MNSWRILVADELAPEGMEILEGFGAVTVGKGMSGPELAAALPGVHALIVRSATKVTREALSAADSLIVIGRAGIGVDNVDVDAATERGIVVMNTPDSGAVTTAEHAVAMLLALARKIPLADRLLHEGRWAKSGLTGVEITGKTLGLIGLGRIGRVVADRAQGLRMRVIAFDPYVPGDRVPDGVTLVSLDRCLAESDFLSVHVPLLEDTRGLLGAEAFGRVKPGCRLVHCARGGIVDEAALVDALERGQVAGAALDVFEREPLDPEHPLLSHPGVICTPHLGASTEEARRAVACDIARQVVTCLESGTVINGVNVPRIAPSDADRLTPFLDLAARLGSFLPQAFGEDLGGLRIETQGQAGRIAAEAIRRAALVGALRAIGAAATPVSAPAIASERGIFVEAAQGIVHPEYVDYVRVAATIGGAEHSCGGTLLGKRGLRMVELEGTTLDATPTGTILMTVHQDQPGVIGQIGSVLGEAGINISRMQLGLRADASGEAMGLLNLDSAPDATLLDAVRRMPFIRSACLVSLPGAR